MVKAGLWTGLVQFVVPPQLLFSQTQRPKTHRFHYYTSTWAIEDFLRIWESLSIIYKHSDIHISIS